MAIDDLIDLTCCERGPLGPAPDGLFVRYQPIVALASGATVGAEALVRGIRPSGEEITPASLVDAAEASGEIGALGEFVLDAACEQARRWIDEDVVTDRFRMHVNVSSYQLRDGALADVVRGALGSLPGSRLVLEITESALLTDRSAIAEQLEELAAVGVDIALDDFGTGYSSLDLVSSLPVDILKIDRLFVERLPDRRSRAVVGAISDLGRALRMEVVAEGIETPAQAVRLRNMGCRLGQGFHFSAPLLPTEWPRR